VIIIQIATKMWPHTQNNLLDNPNRFFRALTAVQNLLFFKRIPFSGSTDDITVAF